MAATRALDRGRTTQAEVEEVLERDVKEVADLQVKAGMGWISDGLLNWQDIFRPLVEAWEGLSLGGLKRWFDNNTFFRQPIFASELEPGPIPAAYTRTDLLPEGERWKAILPGPYTFLRQAENMHYRRWEEALAAVARCLADTCRGLESLGFGLVQFSEPSLAVDPPDRNGFASVKESYDVITTSSRLETSVHVFFGPFQRILPELLDLTVDVIGLDLYEEGVDDIPDYDFDALLACGCVDARNSLLETPEDIRRVSLEVAERLNPKDIILCANADLEFLPRQVAEAKVRVLGDALRGLKEVV